jgi:Nucleotide modification associated domain 3
MRSIYLVNVGANTMHCGEARSPIFDDGSWHYVSFPTSPGKASQKYLDDARSYLLNDSINYTHADPSWDDYTYGDNCANPRAGALKKVQRGDILLFWGLLWRHRGRDDWHGFTGERGWYLFGSFRVQEIVQPEQSVQSVSMENQDRARRNAHFMEAGDKLLPGHHVFLGDQDHSRQFERAVDLEVTSSSGLIYQTFTSSQGALLTRDGSPSWKSSLRSCRKMWDLDDPVSRSRAQIVADAIKKQADFDLLKGL